jgi:DNA ligase (NAD+)
MEWNGFGFEMDKALHSFDYTEANNLVSNILSLKNSLWRNPEDEIRDNNLNGKNLCVTGKLKIFKNRDELVAAVEAAGGKVTSAVSSKTSYLVTNDTESGSSKNIKAKQLNIPIITESQLYDML